MYLKGEAPGSLWRDLEARLRYVKCCELLYSLPAQFEKQKSVGNIIKEIPCVKI
jgi:hypothetical protein